MPEITQPKPTQQMSAKALEAPGVEAVQPVSISPSTLSHPPMLLSTLLNKSSNSKANISPTTETGRTHDDGHSRRRSRR